MRRLTPVATVIASSLLLAGCNPTPPAADPLKPFTSQTLTWAACDPTVLGIPADLVIGSDQSGELTIRKVFAELGERLKCADVKVPLDWSSPSRGTAVMSVIRTTAATPDKRQGAIFFNPGGPGGDGLQFAPLNAYSWARANTETDIGRNLKAMADQYDLIGFSPRGVGNSTRLYCGVNELVDVTQPPASDRSEKNIQSMIKYGQLAAKACQNNPTTPFINTDATVRDLDLTRQLLNEEKLNYIGYSYGTWLGSWYAKRFPQNAGKILLDANMDWSGNMEDTFKLQPRAFERDFRDVVAPYLSRITSTVFGEAPITAQAIYTRERALGEPLRFLVGRDIASALYSRDVLPYLGIELKAASVLDDLIKANPGIGLNDLLALIPAQTYFRDPELNSAALDTAQYLAFYRDFFIQISATPQPVVLSEFPATFTAITCNDTPWNITQSQWRQIDDQEAQTYPLIGGSALSNPCLYWQGARVAQKPALPATMPPVLMVQNEFDPATATEGALKAFDATPSARLIFINEEPQHAAFPYDTACVDLPITTYFLNGTLPDARRTDCQAKPLPSEETVYPVTFSSQGLTGKAACLRPSTLGSQAIVDPRAQAAAQAARQIIVDSARNTWSAGLEVRLPDAMKQKLAQLSVPGTCR